MSDDFLCHPDRDAPGSDEDTEPVFFSTPILPIPTNDPYYSIPKTS